MLCYIKGFLQTVFELKLNEIEMLMGSNPSMIYTTLKQASVASNDGRWIWLQHLTKSCPIQANGLVERSKLVPAADER
jgi:hypothetical protein